MTPPSVRIRECKVSFNSFNVEKRKDNESRTIVTASASAAPKVVHVVVLSIVEVLGFVVVLSLTSFVILFNRLLFLLIAVRAVRSRLFLQVRSKRIFE
jgi:hypothetical protein